MQTIEFYAHIKTELDPDSFVIDHVSFAHIQSLFNASRGDAHTIARKRLRNLQPKELMIIAKHNYYKIAQKNYEIAELGLYIDGLREVEE